MSVMLIREKERVQKPIFYISKILKNAETRYMDIEKLVVTLILAVRKFKMYLDDE